METIWSNKVDEILKVGLSLDNVGVRNWALTKGQALDALKQFLAIEIPVLGGDVYESIDGIIQSNYDSWYCDPLPEETKSAFVRRSIEKAKAYIEEYKSKQIDKIFFVLVPNT